MQGSGGGAVQGSGGGAVHGGGGGAVQGSGGGAVHGGGGGAVQGGGGGAWQRLRGGLGGECGADATGSASLQKRRSYLSKQCPKAESHPAQALPQLAPEALCLVFASFQFLSVLLFVYPNGLARNCWYRFPLYQVHI